MLSLIYGRPGTGKTYEAVKFHILPNLKLGNKIFTNIPVSITDPNLEVNESPQLTDIVKVIDDSEYEITFILDEFQFLLQEDEEAWFQLFAQHRKFRTDFFIITQSPLSLPEKIQDLISFAHKTTHNPFFLKKLSYIKKVYDGVPTEERVVVLNSKLRFYNKKVFGLYDSYYQRNYVKTGNLLHFDNKSNIMIWPIIAACVIVFLIYKFSVEREFSLKSYLDHSSPSISSNKEEKEKIVPVKETKNKIYNEVMVDDNNVGVDQGSLKNSDDELIDIIFKSRVFINGWHLKNKIKVYYYDVWQEKFMFRIKSDNHIFDKIEIKEYEDCLISINYKNNIKFIACPPE